MIGAIFLLLFFCVVAALYFKRRAKDSEEPVEVDAEMLINVRNIARAAREAEVDDMFKNVLSEAAKKIKKMSKKGQTFCVVKVHNKKYDVKKAVISRLIVWADENNISSRVTYTNDGVILDWSKEPEIFDLEPEN